MEPKANALDVLIVVALSGVIRSEEIDLVCLHLCNICRRSVGYAITVETNNAHHFSLPTHDPDTSSMTAQPPTRLQQSRRIYRLNFRLDLPLTEISWPDNLLELKFGWRFDHPLDSSLPSSLLVLDLGGQFNHHIEDVVWPSRLVKLRFGFRFNRPIELANWPSTLRSLIFGGTFNQPIESVKWPESLEYLSLGEDFNHPVKAMAGLQATNLRKIDFGNAFRQPLDGLVWPRTLEELKFGACFDQGLNSKVLPRSLKVLQLPDEYIDDEKFMEGLPRGCEIEGIDGYLPSIDF